MADKKIGTARVDIGANVIEFNSKVDALPNRVDAAAAKIKKSLDGFGSAATKSGKILTSVISAPLLAGAAIAFQSANKIDTAVKQIAVGTGAAGEKLFGLAADFRSVFGQLPGDTETAAAAIADLNTLTGATGGVLQALTVQVLRASTALGESGTENAKAFGRALNQWGIDAAAGIPLMDQLFKLSQDYGIGLNELIVGLNQYSNTLQNANFSAGEAAVFMARLSKSGMEIAPVMSGLTKAFNNWAAEGLDARDMLSQVIAEIQGASTETEALSIASEHFGAKGAQALMVGVRNGAISVDGLADALDGADGQVKKTYESTLKFSDKLKILKNRVMLAAEPIGVELLNAFESVFPYLESGAKFVGQLATKFANLPSPAKKTILVIAGLAAAIGPALLAVGAIASGISGIAAAVAVAAPAIAMLGAASGPVAVAAIGFIAWYKAIKTVIDNWDFLREHFSNVAQSIADVGRSIMTGLWEGVESKIDWLKAKFTAIGEMIPDTIKKVLDIQSPSKVMAEIGGQAAAGLAEGWGAGLEEMAYYMTTWADVGKETFLSMTDSLGNTMSDFVHDAFRGQLKSAEDYFTSFADAILSSFVSMVTQMAAQNMMVSLFGGGMGIGGNILGGLAGTAGVGVAGSTAGGAVGPSAGLFAGSTATGAAAGASITLASLLAAAGATVGGGYALSQMGGWGSDILGGTDEQQQAASALAPLYGPMWFMGSAISNIMPEDWAAGIASMTGTHHTEGSGQRQVFADWFGDMFGIGLNRRHTNVFEGQGIAAENMQGQFAQYGGSLDLLTELAEGFREKFGMDATTIEDVVSMFVGAAQENNLSAVDAEAFFAQVYQQLALSDQNITDEELSVIQTAQETVDRLSKLMQWQTALLSNVGSLDTSMLSDYNDYISLINEALSGSIGAFEKLESKIEQNNEININIAGNADGYTIAEASGELSDRLLDNAHR